jgi:hypothetical protein
MCVFEDNGGVDSTQKGAYCIRLKHPLSNMNVILQISFSSEMQSMNCFKEFVC